MTTMLDNHRIFLPVTTTTAGWSSRKRFNLLHCFVITSLYPTAPARGYSVSVLTDFRKCDSTIVAVKDLIKFKNEDLVTEIDHDNRRGATRLRNSFP